MSNPSILALITARIHSKRVPYKHFRNLGGKALYMWTTKLPIIDIVDTIAFSSDNPDMFKLPDYILPIKRPEELARDDTPHPPVIVHGLGEAERILDRTFDYVLLLQPTNPTRTYDDVNAMVSIINTKKPYYAITYYIDDNLRGSYMLSMSGDDIVTIRSGSMYAYSRTMIENGFSIGEDCITEVLQVTKRHGYNINTDDDFAIAEAFLKAEGRI